MASSALMPTSASNVPTQDDRPVVVQCPYTLSSCPLFNPTFTTAEVLDAGRSTGSGCAGVAPSPRDRNMPGGTSTGASRSSESPRRYGLVESMRKAASPPSHTVELDEASPFQYIDFPIAPLEEASTPRCPAQAASVSPKLQGFASGPTTPPEVAARVQLEVVKPVAVSAQPTYQYQPQQPSLYGDMIGRSRVASGSSIAYGHGEVYEPTYASTSSLIRPQTAATYTGGTYPSITMPRRFSADSPVGTSFPSCDSGYADLGQPDLSVAYELAGMASRSRTSHSPHSPASQPSFLQQSTLQGIAGANGTLSSGVVLPYVEQDRHSSHSRASSAEQQVEPQDTGGQLYASGHTPGQPKAATPFISKLNHLLSDPSYADVIRWNEDGTVILYAHTSPRLLDILGRFFRHTTVSSFARQLNIYAFHRLNTSELLTQLEKSRSVGVRGCASEWSGFSHELMWRDDPNKPACDLGRLKPSGPKTEKGKQNLAKKIAENGGSVKKRKKAGPSTTRNASPKEDSE